MAHIVRSPVSLTSTREDRCRLVEDTLRIVGEGEYSTPDGTKYRFGPVHAWSLARSQYFAPSALDEWQARPPDRPRFVTSISILQCTTIEGVQALHDKKEHIGVLAFASPTTPGGDVILGRDSQEESIARSSTLLSSLNLKNDFYDFHAQHDTEGFNSNGMVYSPAVVIFRDDKGILIPPLQLNVVSCSPVNATEARRRYDRPEIEEIIDDAMAERMARILCLFEQRGDRYLVLGSFGSGTFGNRPKMVARCWANLLIVHKARFLRSFERIIFAVRDEPDCLEFRTSFEREMKIVPLQQAPPGVLPT